MLIMLLAAPSTEAAAPTAQQAAHEAVEAGSDDAPASRDPDALARRRLLHAVGGGVLRAQSRKQDRR